MKSPIILVKSSRMDSNRKKDRNEDGLIRMGNKARENLGLAQEKTVELWPKNNNSLDRINRSKVLDIFHAYKEDLRGLRNSDMPEEEYLRVGFVTTRTFEYICKRHSGKGSIWLADTVEDTVIGGDPEFILVVEEGVYKYAGQVMDFPHNAKLGSDGPWAELRPDPEIKVEHFVQNIKSLLTSDKLIAPIEEYGWLAGCYYYGVNHPGPHKRSWPVGGHIHIGNPGKLSHINENFGDFYKAAVFTCLKKILDELIGAPLMKIDGIENAVNRRKEFGTFGDVRIDHGRLEYRTPSGEWLSHPKLATLVLGATKAIAHEFFKLLDGGNYDYNLIMTEQIHRNSHVAGCYSRAMLLSDDFSEWKSIGITNAMGTVRSSGRLKDMINNGNFAINKQFITALKKKFKSLSTYREYSEYLDGFIEVISLPAEELNARDKDLRHTWVEGADFII